MEFSAHSRYAYCTVRAGLIDSWVVVDFILVRWQWSAGEHMRILLYHFCNVFEMAFCILTRIKHQRSSVILLILALLLRLHSFGSDTAETTSSRFEVNNRSRWTLSDKATVIPQLLSQRWWASIRMERVSGTNSELIRVGRNELRCQHSSMLSSSGEARKPPQLASGWRSCHRWCNPILELIFSAIL